MELGASTCAGVAGLTAPENNTTGAPAAEANSTTCTGSVVTAATAVAGLGSEMGIGAVAGSAVASKEVAAGNSSSAANAAVYQEASTLAGSAASTFGGLPEAYMMGLVPHGSGVAVGLYTSADTGCKNMMVVRGSNNTYLAAVAAGGNDIGAHPQNNACTRGMESTRTSFTSQNSKKLLYCSGNHCYVKPTI